MSQPTLRQGPVTFDRRSFRVGPDRVWLHAGEIHYFRHPHELWRETLQRAKAAGLNTISTYVAWNFHEETAGRFDFTGDRDVGHFIDLCAELGLYVVARPGPYICSEWDGGGLPAWLSCQRTRDNDPAFVGAMRRWFARVLPVIAARQVSRGGPVILVQNENEYAGGWNESTRTYIRAINDCFRGAGIDVPIIACNAHGGTSLMVNYSPNASDQILWPDLIVTYNWAAGTEPVRELRKKQPHAPLFMTEFWSGSQMFWGKPISDWPAPAEYARGMMEFASVGCQTTCYMFDGGTNFGYWAGSNIVTSYQANAPIRDGGVLGEKFYLLRPVNQFITQFGAELADSEEVPAEVTGPVGARLVMRQCPAGRLLFISEAGTATSLRLSNGLDVAMPFIRALALPVGLDVLPGVRIDSANVGLLARTTLWGVAGTLAEVTVNGQRQSGIIPAEQPLELRFGAVKLLVVSEHLAERTGLEPLLSSNRQTPPALGEWRMQVCAEVAGGGDGWLALPDGPRTHDELGRLFGYVWYRAEYEAAADGVLTLTAPLLSSRLMVYANGSYAGTIGELGRLCSYRHPADAWRQEQVLVPVRAGNNVLVFLSDNLGRTFTGHLDPQGLAGPVCFDAARIALSAGQAFGPAPVSDEALRALYHRDFREPRPLPGVELTVEAEEAFLMVPVGFQNVVVAVDGRFVAGLSGHWTMGMTYAPYRGVRLPAGRNVRVQFESLALADAFVLVAARRKRPGNWSWKPGGDWPGEPAGSAVATAGALAWGGLVPVQQQSSGGGRTCPTWFTTTFPLPGGAAPVFLNIGRMHKGQIFLNGHNVGRFWQVGGQWQGNGVQHRYYLPRPWMRAQNTLAIFEEYGLRPNGVGLE